jgi:hypothetical protein
MSYDEERTYVGGGGRYSRIGCREGAYVENIYISRTFFGGGVILYLASCDNV